MRTVIRVIDSISEWVGKTARWFVVALVLLETYGVIRRYVFNAPELWPYEVAIMLGAAVWILGLSYVHRYDGHVRVDVIYSRLSPRLRGIIDVIGSILSFFPIFILVLYVSANWAWDAWITDERMAETGWYPPSAPLRTVVMLGFLFFALQGVAQFVRALHLLRRSKPYD